MTEQTDPISPKDDKKFSRDDLGKLIEKQKLDWQAAQDKIMNDKIAELQKKNSEENAKAIKEAAEKAQKEAKMNADELDAKHRQEEREEIEKERKELKLMRLSIEAKDQLTSQDLPKEFSDFVIGQDSEETKQHIATLKSAFDKAVSAEVEKRLSGRSNTSAGNNTSKTTNANIKDLSIDDLMAKVASGEITEDDAVNVINSK